MRYLFRVITIMCVLAVSAGAFAGKTTTQTFKGNTYRATTKTWASKPTAFKTISTKPSSTSMDGFTSTTRRKPVTSAEFLSRSTIPPSPALKQLVTEHERSSGPGWLGTAFLVSALSRHDLSSSDRDWLQSQLKESQKEDPPYSNYRHDFVANLEFIGIDQPIHMGAPVNIEVRGTSAPECNLSSQTAHNLPAFQIAGHVAKLNNWKPEISGLYYLNCSAGLDHSKRAIQVESM